MSDMSFKQAKEIVERLEFCELALKKSFEDINKSTKMLKGSSKIFEKSLEKQEYILKQAPQMSKKNNILQTFIIINISFFVGLFLGKFFL